jgi:protoheme IX farnesyltransferase
MDPARALTPLAYVPKIQEVMSIPALSRRDKISAYVGLTKPRIVTMVLVMSASGFFLGAKGLQPLYSFFILLVGTAMSSAGAAVLNNYLERDCDGLMNRTKKRALPCGAISPAEALSFGLILVLLGVSLLTWQVNLLTGFLSLLTVFLYVLVYTPLKRVTWLNTIIGAVPGALPPVGGWAAATGHLELGAWVLFLILFIWQHPHFYAIAWMYRDDYSRGGFKMLPVVDPDGASTFRQVIIFSVLLIPASLLPLYAGMAGALYGWGIFALGLVMLGIGINLARTRSVQDARLLLKASVIYLPLFFILIMGDRGF